MGGRGEGGQKVHVARTMHLLGDADTSLVTVIIGIVLKEQFTVAEL